MAYLLDTNAWIVYLKSPTCPIRQRLQSLEPADVFVCSVVKAELLHGAEKYERRDRRLALVEETLPPYASLPFDDLAASYYARIRHELDVQGTPIGPSDLMIASIAVANQLTLVSHNRREFGRVAGLALEDWEAGN